jgi:hypothetical protein
MLAYVAIVCYVSAYSTRFEVAPNTLVLCLKRFGTGRFGKINKVLVYGEQLDLGPFMAAGAMDEGPATYTLTGVVVHLDQVRRGWLGWGGVYLLPMWWVGCRVVARSARCWCMG